MSEEPIERRFLIRRPRALQWFHHGRLKKASEKERVAGRFELFFDLLYVSLVANFADALSEEPTGARLVTFVLTFTPAWHAWADAKENANTYFNDDIIQRLGILWIMALLVVYGNNANAVADDLGALRATVASYQCIRFTQIAYYLYYSLASHWHRTQNRAYFAMIAVSICLCIPLHFPKESVSNSAKVGIAATILGWEQCSYLLTFGPWLTRWLKMPHSTAVDIDHENDRYTSFTIIVLGEFTYAILVNSPAQGGLNLRMLRAVWTLVIAFCFNGMYVYADGSVEHTHPIRRSVWTSFAWLLLHLPLSAGLLIGGHISAVSVVEEELGRGRRWLWGGGLAVSFFFMWVLALLWRDDDQCTLYMPKMLRVGPRLASTVVFALLPLTSEEQLDATMMVSAGAAISAFVVIWETFGGLEKDACIFESWKGPPSEEGVVDLGHVVSRDDQIPEFTDHLPTSDEADDVHREQL